MTARAAKLLIATAWLAFASLAPACYQTTPCGLEQCDGLDNDCDGETDEDYRDGLGRFTTEDHCGSCEVSCEAVFPDARRTRCAAPAGEEPHCEVTACPPGEQLLGGACAPPPNVLCMGCESDEDCARLVPGAVCLIDAGGSGRCAPPCAGDCPAGFACVLDDSTGATCQPQSGSCACDASLAGVELGCTLRGTDEALCAGVQRCEAFGLTTCEAALSESCNTADDDCDGAIDEGFVDALGRYISAEHCGGCGRPCAAPGPHMSAECVVSRADGIRCELACERGFVDTDGLRATGCECELQRGPGVVIGADADCNGRVDPTPDYVFVAPGGDDANDGGDASAPLRTIQKGLERGEALGRSVLVARGIYRGPIALRDGVSLLGGYSPDFRERDFSLYPVLIEADPTDPGAPVVRGDDIVSATQIDGLTIVGGDALGPGAGTTAVYLDGCGPALLLSNLTVLAGRGADGVDGADSSANLAQLGLSSLAELAGVDGADGEQGNAAGAVCAEIAAGDGGAKQCPSGPVSGGDGGAAICADLSLLCDNATDPPCGNAGCTDFTDGGGVCDLDAARAVAVVNPSAQDGAGTAPGEAGEPAYAAPTNRDACSFCDDNPSLPRMGGDGADGEPGDDGASGTGCPGIELMNFATGRVSAGAGGDGTGGIDGSGGGGATAGGGFAVIGNTTGTCGNVAGGSGGGGGSGGCGAPGADRGSGGGGSVGVIVRLASGDERGPELKDVRVVTGSGGDGGAGGIGAAGGPGGAGGIGGGSQFWCARDGGRGGDGGKGGAAGGGGGGCGGGSYGIYLAGDAGAAYVRAVRGGLTVERAGVAGRGGAGGFSPGGSATSGQNGQTVDLVLTPG